MLALRRFDLFFGLGSHCEDFFRQLIKLVCEGLLGIQLSDKLIEFLVQNDQHWLDGELALHVTVIFYDICVEDFV